METLVYSVKGMTCQSCVKSITFLVSKLENVQSCVVDLEQEIATVVTFLSSRELTELIKNTIEDAGFDAQLVSSILAPTDTTYSGSKDLLSLTPSPANSSITLDVFGMTCKSCVKSIEVAVEKIHGIHSVDVSLSKNNAVVQYNPNECSPQTIILTIEDCGFDVIPPEHFRQELPSFKYWTCKARNLQNESISQDIKSQLSSLDGVHTVIIDTKNNTICVEYNTGVIENTNFASIARQNGAHIVETNIDTLLTKVNSQLNSRAQAGFDSNTNLSLINPSGVSMSPSTSQLTELGDDVEWVASFDVRGMTCASCVNLIERSLGDIPQVTEVSVNLLAQQATIKYRSRDSMSTLLMQEISKLGFTPTERTDEKVARVNEDGSTKKSSGNSARADLLVYGMTCSSCVSTIEDALSSLHGVKSASVSLALQSATIKFDKRYIGIRDIVQKVEELGFDATVNTKIGSAQIESLKRTEEILMWRKNAVFSLWLGVPTFLLAKILPNIGFLRGILMTNIIKGLPIGICMELILTTILIFTVGTQFFKRSYKAIKSGYATMDVLVATGSGLAYASSVLMLTYTVIQQRHAKAHCFFEAAALLITFVSIGRYLENMAKGSASNALAELMTLTPSRALLILRNEHGEVVEEKLIASELVQVGDELRIYPGERIAADGTIIEGATEIDESTVTGEALPISKAIGDHVIAGTVNSAGSISIKCTQVGPDTALAQIVKLVEDAQVAKTPIQLFADRVSQYFVPMVLVLGVATFIFWIILSTYPDSYKPQIFLDHVEATGSGFIVALQIAVAVVVVACPCALGLSTPTAVMVGTGVGARMGILIKGGDALETAHNVSTIVFDKTGTLTKGELDISSLHIDPNWPERLFLALVGAAESRSEHSIGKSIFKYCDNILSKSIIASCTDVTDFRALVGMGIRCNIEILKKPVFFDPSAESKYSVLIGNLKLMELSQVDIPQHAIKLINKNERIGCTVLLVAINREYAGLLALSDILRPEARSTVSALKAMGIQVIMVTGDQPQTAKYIAKSCGIDTVYAGISPSGKQDIISYLQTQPAPKSSRSIFSRLYSAFLRTRKMNEYQSINETSRVAMVGDGINDSPALAAADVGISIVSGTHVAMEAATMVLMRKDIFDVVACLDLSKTIFRRIRINYFWACLYNFVGIPIAMGFFLPFGIELPPVFAGAAMAMSSLSVMASSLLLKLYNKPIYRASNVIDDYEPQIMSFDAIQSQHLLAPSNGQTSPTLTNLSLQHPPTPADSMFTTPNSTPKSLNTYENEDSFWSSVSMKPSKLRKGGEIDAESQILELSYFPPTSDTPPASIQVYNSDKENNTQYLPNFVGSASTMPVTNSKHGNKFYTNDALRQTAIMNNNLKLKNGDSNSRSTFGTENGSSGNTFNIFARELSNNQNKQVNPSNYDVELHFLNDSDTNSSARLL